MIKIFLFLLLFFSLSSLSHSFDFPSLSLDQKLRILIFSVDDREIDLELNPSTGSYSLAIVLNHNYAAKNGYDFKHFVPSFDTDKIFKTYQITKPKIDTGTDPRLNPFTFHPGFKQFRSVTYTKLLVMWHISKEFSQLYDLVVYIDSDAVFTAAKSNRTITDALRSWKTEQKITWGLSDLEKSGIIFLPNSPFGNWEPATGMVIFRPDLSSAMFEDWWNYNLPDYFLTPFFDQNVLWSLFQHEPQTQFSLNKSSTSMVSEHQFPVDMTIDDWCFHYGWICHVNGNWAKDRHRVFRRMLHSEAGESNSENAAKIYRHVRQLIEKDTIKFDALETAEKILSQKPAKVLGEALSTENTSASTSAAPHMSTLLISENLKDGGESISSAGKSNVVSGSASPTLPTPSNSGVKYLSRQVVATPSAYYAGDVKTAKIYAAQQDDGESQSNKWVENIAVFALGGLKSSQTLKMEKVNENDIDYFSRAEASKLTWARYLRHYYYVTGSGPAETTAFGDPNRCMDITAASLPSKHFKDQQKLYFCAGVHVLHFPQCDNSAWGSGGPCCRCSHSMRFFLQLTRYHTLGASKNSSLTNSADQNERQQFSPEASLSKLEWFVFADDDYFMRMQMLETLLRQPSTPFHKPFSLFTVSSLGSLTPAYGLEMYNKNCSLHCVHKFPWMSWGGFSLAAVQQMEPAILHNDLTSICTVWKTTHDVGLGVLTWMQSFPAVAIYDREMFEEQMPLVWHNPVRFNASGNKYDQVIHGLWKQAAAAWLKETNEELAEDAFDMEIFLAHERYQGEHYAAHIPHVHIKSYRNSLHHRRQSLVNEIKHQITDDVVSLKEGAGDNTAASGNMDSLSAASRDSAIYGPQNCVEDTENFERWFKQYGAGGTGALPSSNQGQQVADEPLFKPADATEEAKVCIAYAIFVANSRVDASVEGFTAYINKT